MVPVLKADHRPPETLAGCLSLLKPQDHRLTVQVLGTPARDVGQVDPAGGESFALRSEVLERGVVERSVATSAHLGPQVVAGRAKATELLPDPLRRQIAARPSVPNVHTHRGDLRQAGKRSLFAVAANV